MSGLSFQRYCAEIVTQTDLLRSAIRGGDMTVPVPSCPGWNVGQLVRHLGGGQRWAATIVGTKATQPPSDDHFRDLAPYANESAAVLDDWLAEGAAELSSALSAAGPEAEVWTPLRRGGAKFYARRFTHETVMHRADATLALGQQYHVEQDVAIDAMDEWLDLGSLPEMFDYHPERRKLLGEGRTLHFHATDTPPEANAEWVFDLTGGDQSWRRAHEKCAVAARATVTDLLLMLYGRKSAHSAEIEIFGDTELLTEFLDSNSFG